MGKRVYKENGVIIVQGKGGFIPDAIAYTLNTDGYVRIKKKSFPSPLIKIRWEKLQRKNNTGFTNQLEVREYLDSLFQSPETPHIIFNSLPNLP